MDRGAWWATVHGVAKSRTRLKRLSSSSSSRWLLFWRRKWQPTPVFLPRESRVQRTLMGCCPWGHKSQSRLKGLNMHACTGEGNGNSTGYWILQLDTGYSSVLAWRIPGTEEPGGLPPVVSHRVGHDWSDLAAAAWLLFPFNRWRNEASGYSVIHPNLSAVNGGAKI